MNDLTLITCSFETPDITLNMLRSYVKVHGEGSFNVLIMENSKDEATRDLLRKENIPFITNKGMSHEDGMNIALKNCKTKYALIVDTDVIFYKSLQPLFDQFKREDATLMGTVCGDRGGKSLKFRIHPWFCFVNIDNLNKHNIIFNDVKRYIIRDEKDGKTYDVAASMFEDVLKNNLHIINSDAEGSYFKHYEGMSWRKNHLDFQKWAGEVKSQYDKETEGKFYDTVIKDKFIKGYDEFLYVQPIFGPNEYHLQRNLKSLESMFTYLKECPEFVKVAFGGWCATDDLWNAVQEFIKNNFKDRVVLLKRFEGNYGKAVVVNDIMMSDEIDKLGVQYVLSADSDICYSTDNKFMFNRMKSCAEQSEIVKGKKFGLLACRQTENDRHYPTVQNNKFEFKNIHRNTDEVVVWPTDPSGIAGGCWMFSLEAWRKIGGYRIMGVYAGDDAYFLLYTKPNNLTWQVVNTISVVHPWEEDPDYGAWKGSVCGRDSNGKNNNITKQIEEAANFWKNKGDYKKSVLKETTIVIPTFNRPAALCNFIQSLGDNKKIIVVVDRDRQHVDIPASIINKVQIVLSEPGCGAVKAAENGIMACDTRFVVNLNDDMELTNESEGWLEELCRVYETELGYDVDGVVSLKDGIQNGRIASFALFTRKFYIDNVYPAPYFSYYVDNEMSDKARCLDVYRYAEKAFIQHLAWHVDSSDLMQKEGRIFTKRMEDWKASKKI